MVSEWKERWLWRRLAVAVAIAFLSTALVLAAYDLLTSGALAPSGAGDNTRPLILVPVPR